MNKALLYLSLLVVTSPVPFAFSASEEVAIEDFLHANYYQIEFFIFARPEVMEFNSGENLTLEDGRSFPFLMRHQASISAASWPLPIDSLTRACLTFPTLSYQLLPLLSDTLPDEVLDELTDQERDEVLGEIPEGRMPIPVPSIAPSVEAHPLLDFMAGMSEFERSLAASSRQWLEFDTFLLAADARRVERSGLGRILFHGKWIQDVPPRESPDPILIQAGRKLSFPDPVHELEGTVSVTLGRYLHFQTELFFHGPGLGLTPVAAALTATGEPVLDSMEPPITHFMRLSESRRMRSTEIHYLDHPKLGVVVRIDPVEIPQPLVVAFDSLEEDVE